MNRAAQVIDYLSAPGKPATLILAPGAPPVSRDGASVSVAIGTVFDTQDIGDTLQAFRTRSLTPSGADAMRATGSFSFGIKDVGRFRVYYATQRGSRILSITKIPHDIPAPAVACEDAGIMRNALTLLSSGRPGFTVIGGPNAVDNALFAYMLLQSVNHDGHKVLFVLERALTFLMKHENCLVIQCELNGDVGSLEEGLDEAALFEPHILYVGDLKPADDLPGIARAVGNGAHVILSSVLLDPLTLLKRYSAPIASYALFAPLANAAFTVNTGPTGKLLIKAVATPAES